LLEAFLLANKNDYERDGAIRLAEKFNKKNNDVKTPNTIKKAKAKLLKYGIWNNTDARLDDVEQQIKEIGLVKINYTGVRDWCRENAERYNLSDNSLRAKITGMIRYGLL
tara:strand:+ start:148 stop:477 length:330 start_codon:yes stop_codon:yes gene_type:complete